MSSKQFARNIGRIKKMQDFCHNRGLHVRSISDDEEPVSIAIDAIKELIDRNKNISTSSNNSDTESCGIIMPVDIYFDGDLIASGRIHVADAESIVDLDDRFMVDTKLKYNGRRDKNISK